MNTYVVSSDPNLQKVSLILQLFKYLWYSEYEQSKQAFARGHLWLVPLSISMSFTMQKVLWNPQTVLVHLSLTSMEWGQPITGYYVIRVEKNNLAHYK